MKDSYWIEKWEKGDTAFHQSSAHPRLVRFADRLPQGKVFVPLCGKSLDMLYLSRAGHGVVGAELSPIACEAFFVENGIAFSLDRRGEHEVFVGGGISIWCGDFFRMPKDALADVASVYDRAALIAFSPDLRRRYARYLVDVLPLGKSPNFAMLLIAIAYPTEGAEGPPFSVPESEVRALYSDTFAVECLDRGIDEAYRKHPKFPDRAVEESAYRLTLSPLA